MALDLLAHSVGATGLLAHSACARPWCRAAWQAGPNNRSTEKTEYYVHATTNIARLQGKGILPFGTLAGVVSVRRQNDESKLNSSSSCVKRYTKVQIRGPAGMLRYMRASPRQHARDCLAGSRESRRRLCALLPAPRSMLAYSAGTKVSALRRSRRYGAVGFDVLDRTSPFK